MIGFAKMQETHLRVMSWSLLWLGCALVVVGFVTNSMWNNVPWAEAALLGGLGLAAALIAWALKRLTGAALATSTALVWLLALVYYAGFASFAAVALLAVASLALGSLFIPADWPARGTLSILAGLALISGVVGWLLPFPVHGRAAYCIVLLAMILVRWRVIGEVLRPMPQAWRAAVAAAPVGMWLAVMGTGIATTCAWMPTVHFDDLAGHLALPSQLVSLGYYKMDAASQVWAVTAWASDVLQGVAWLVAGRESRGMLDAFWLLLGLALMWRLCEALDLPPWLRCLAVALYASLPLTVGAMTGMQTEGPTTALVAGIALLIQRSSKPDRRQLLAFAVLFGLLLAMKVSNLMIAGPLGLWLLCRWRARLPWSTLPVALLLLLLVAGSSYTYGWLLTGNPVLPVFNAIFRSPYYTPTNFHDDHWDAGFHWNIVWNLVFHTSRYVEGGDGTAGFVLIALGGSLLVALFHRRSRPLALVALGSFLLPLSQIQYLRYAHQALVLMIPAMLCGMSVLVQDAQRRRWVAGVLGALILTNLVFVPTADWQLRHGELGQFLTQSRREFMEHYAPIERVIELVDNRYGATARVLITSDTMPFAAGFAGRAYVVGWYDQELGGKAARANQDATGNTWTRLLNEIGVNLLVLKSGQVSTALASALATAHGRLVLQEGDLQLWEIGRAVTGFLQPGPPDTVSVKFDVSTLPDGPTLAKTELVLDCQPQAAPIALSWSMTRQGAEPWSYYRWANCLPDGVARVATDFAVPQAIDGLAISARSATSTPMKLSLASAGLDARPDFGAHRDLARRMRQDLASNLTRWVDPRTAKSVQHAGFTLRPPAHGVAVGFDTKKSPSRAGFVQATLELGCRYAPTPIVVGWKTVEEGGVPELYYAWAQCGRNGVAHASFDTKVKRRLTSFTVTAVPAQGADMDLRLVGADSSYVTNKGFRGVVNRKRIKFAQWLMPAPGMVRVEP